MKKNDCGHRIHLHCSYKRILLKPAFLLLVIMFLGSYRLFAQVTVANVTSGSVNTNVTSITVAHDPGTGNYRLMVVGISYREGGTISSVTFGGDPLTQLACETSSNNAKTCIFYILDPPSGSADVVVSVSGGNFDKGCVIGVTTFNGVDQNTPFNTSATGAGTSQNPSLSSIESDTSQLTYAVVASRNFDLTGVGTSQTSRWNVASGDEIRGAGSTKPGELTSTTMSWTRAAGANGNWSISAVSIRRYPVADLQVTKTVNKSNPYPGETVRFTITAKNNGWMTAINAYVSDALPSGYTYSSHSAGTGTYDNSTGIWNIGTITSGTSYVLTIDAVVKSTGTYTNTATIGADVIDNTSSNNSASASVTPCQAGSSAPIFK